MFIQGTDGVENQKKTLVKPHKTAYLSVGMRGDEFWMELHLFDVWRYTWEVGKHRLYLISPKEELHTALKKESPLSKHIFLCSHIFGILQ